MKDQDSNVQALAGAAITAIALLTMAACGGPNVVAGDDPLDRASQVAIRPTLGAADCDPPSQAWTNRHGDLETRPATATDTIALALFPAGDPVVGQPQEVLWRVNGSHQLRLVAVGPSDQRVIPSDVRPDASIAWDRPGDAWTSSFTFDEPGCWRIAISRGPRLADLWLMVA